MKKKLAWLLTKIAMKLDESMQVSYEKDGCKMIVASAIDTIAKGELVVGYRR